MKKKIEKIIKTKAGDVVFRVGVTKSGERFSFRPQVVPHWHSLHTLKYNNGAYDSKSLYVPMFCQIFWLGVCFYIGIGSRVLGESRMVNYNDTHLAEIEKALRNS